MSMSGDNSEFVSPDDVLTNDQQSQNPKQQILRKSVDNKQVLKSASRESLNNRGSLGNSLENIEFVQN